MSSNDSTFRPAFTLMSGRVLAFAVTFLTPVLLVRVFSQAEFGTYKQFTLVAYTLYLIGQLGLAECLFYFVPANPQGSSKYALNSLLMLGLSGMVCLAGLMLTSSFIADRMRNPALAHYTPIMGFFVLFMLMDGTGNHDDRPQALSFGSRHLRRLGRAPNGLSGCAGVRHPEP